jgi:uncharacterized protein
MDLPTFRYHPNPIASGSVVASDAACVCCRQRRGFIYAGPAYSESELDDALCPWCIADDIAREIVEEIALRTPGFAAWQQEKWLACCGDAAAFLEPIGHTELRLRYPQLEGALMMYIVHELEISGAAAVRLLQSLDRDRGPTAYVFACRHCDNKPAYIDFL